MSTLRQFTCDDLFRFNGINLDPLTEMYGLSFYLQYMARWPEYFMVAESPSGDLMGYIMGKSEGQNENWHGHVTAVTVGPEHRRLGKDIIKRIQLTEQRQTFRKDLSQIKLLVWNKLF